MHSGTKPGGRGRGRSGGPSPARHGGQVAAGRPEQESLGAAAGLIAGPGSRSRLALAAALGVVVAVLATHGPALSARALSFDDEQYLAQNLLVRHPSWANAGRFFSEVRHPSTVRGYYQPLAMISLMLDTAMGGNPEHLAPYHFTSLALHAINTVLVMVLLHLLFGNPWVAALVGLLFGVHPLTVEPIPWIGERKTLLASCFALASLIAYVRYAREPRASARADARRWWAYGAAILFYVLALLSKPTTTPLPVLMLMLDYWPLGRLSRRSVLEKLPLLAIAGVFVVITLVSQGQTAGVIMPGQRGPGRIMLILAHNIVFYPWKMVWPAGLSSHYPFPAPMSLSNPVLAASVAGTLVLLAGLAISLRWTRALLTGWLFFFICILPTMGVIGFTNVIASDKYVYLPALGVLMVLAWALTRALAGRPAAVAWAVAAACLGIAGAEAAASRAYLADWQTAERLYRRMARVHPEVSLLHAMVATELIRQERIPEALVELEQARRLSPVHPEAYTQMGVLLERQGRREEALAEFNQALALTPAPEVQRNLGKTLAELGRYDEAVAHLQEAIHRRPLYLRAINDLAGVLILARRMDEAAATCRRALQLDAESFEAHSNLGLVRFLQGQPEAAMAEYTAALRLNPGSAEAHNNLGRLLLEAGQTDEAVGHFQEAVRLRPDSPEVHKNLAAGLAGRGAADEAMREYEEALRLRPAYLQARLGLAEVLIRQGRLAEAGEHYRAALQIDPSCREAREALAGMSGARGVGGPSSQGQ